MSVDFFEINGVQERMTQSMLSERFDTISKLLKRLKASNEISQLDFAP